MPREIPSLNLMLCAILCFSLEATKADPPTIVARLTDITGTTTLLPAGETQWIVGLNNRPLTQSDKLWNDTNSKSQLQLDSAVVDIGENTNVNLLNINDHTTQLQILQGRVNLCIWELKKNKLYEINTPNLALQIKKPGYYRVNVNKKGNGTTIAVRSGLAAAYGEDASYLIGPKQLFRFTGTDLHRTQSNEMDSYDELDEWTAEHLRKTEKSSSTKYLSSEVIGYEDLDKYGTWQEIEGYGSGWSPKETNTNWAPFREGRWIWIDPWGWNWVGNEPWGFTPYHYGRWAYANEKWIWIPGPIEYSPIYSAAPAAFIGGNNFPLSKFTKKNIDIAWFPLAPGEIYRFPLPVSSNYFINLNVSNTTMNKILVAHAYNHPEMQIFYKNQQIPNSITALSATAFLCGTSTKSDIVAIPIEKIPTVNITPTAMISPEKTSVFGEAYSKTKPADDILRRSSIAKSKYSATTIPFSIKQLTLKQQIGRPIDSQTLANLKQKFFDNTDQSSALIIRKNIKPSYISAPANKGNIDPDEIISRIILAKTQQYKKATNSSSENILPVAQKNGFSRSRHKPNYQRPTWNKRGNQKQIDPAKWQEFKRQRQMRN